MPILSLCTGYGGLDEAVEAITGDSVAYMAESDPAASRLLAERFPNVPNLGDIQRIDWTQYVGLVDIIAAGFPCQDISHAGPREGIKGERSSVWFNVADAIRIIRPRIAFLENVAGLRSRGLGEVLSSLSEIRYDTRWTMLRASSVGACHHRERWFGIATPAKSSCE